MSNCTWRNVALGTTLTHGNISRYRIEKFCFAKLAYYALSLFFSITWKKLRTVAQMKSLRLMFNSWLTMLQAKINREHRFWWILVFFFLLCKNYLPSWKWFRLKSIHLFWPESVTKYVLLVSLWTFHRFFFLLLFTSITLLGRRVSRGEKILSSI